MLPVYFNFLSMIHIHITHIRSHFLSDPVISSAWHMLYHYNISLITFVSLTCVDQRYQHMFTLQLSGNI